MHVTLHLLIQAYTFTFTRTSPRKQFEVSCLAFFQYNRYLLRQNAVGACLYAPQHDSPPPNFEVIPPPQIKLAFPRPSNCKFREKNCSREFKTFEAKQFIFYFLLICFVTLILRLSQTASDPTRLIRPRPIDCDCGIETPVKIFLGFFLEKRIFFLLCRYLGTTSAPKEAHSRIFVTGGHFSRHKNLFKCGQTETFTYHCFLGAVI